MPVTQETYERVALEDPEGKWELICGQLRRKPDMTVEHNWVSRRLNRQLAAQLPPEFDVAMEMPRLTTPDGRQYVPDVCVLPVALARGAAGSTRLEAYRDPLPLVVEVWSPSTGEYDVETKYPDYRARGDLEVWRIHPHERTLIAWRRQPDGTYTETLYTRGAVPIASLPGISIDLDALFL